LRLKRIAGSGDLPFNYGIIRRYLEQEWGWTEFFNIRMRVFYENVASCCDVVSCCRALPTEGVPSKGTVRELFNIIFIKYNKLIEKIFNMDR
jgi:hypothetical protein